MYNNSIFLVKLDKVTDIYVHYKHDYNDIDNNN